MNTPPIRKTYQHWTSLCMTMIYLRTIKLLPTPTIKILLACAENVGILGTEILTHTPPKVVLSRWIFSHIAFYHLPHHIWSSCISRLADPWCFALVFRNASQSTQSGAPPPYRPPLRPDSPRGLRRRPPVPKRLLRIASRAPVMKLMTACCFSMEEYCYL